MNNGYLFFTTAIAFSLFVLVFMWLSNLLTLQRFFRSLSLRGYMGKSGIANRHILLTGNRCFRKMLSALDIRLVEMEGFEGRTVRWLGDIVHDLKAPLSAIQGYAEIMDLSRPALSTHEFQEYAGAIRRVGDRMQSMVSDLEYVSLLKGGEKEMEWEVLSLAELTFDTLEMFSGRIAEKGLQLKRVFPNNLCQIRGNIGLVERSIQNVIQNAIQYCRDSGEVVVDVGSQGKMVELVISNSLEPESISEAELPLLLERGRRGQGQKKEGSGLGLAIVREIMDFHEGTVEVKSTAEGTIMVKLSFPGL